MKNHSRGTFTSENGVMNPMYLTSPLGHSSPLNRSPRESSSDWSHSLGSASLDRVSRASHSSDQMSPASSLDSMNQSQEEHQPHQRNVTSHRNIQDHFHLDFEHALQKNLGLGMENRINLGQQFIEMNSPNLLPDSGFPSLSSIQSLSSNSGFDR